MTPTMTGRSDAYTENENTWLSSTAEKMHVKSGSSVFTTLVNETVPYAGATVDSTWPRARKVETLASRRRSLPLSSGAARPSPSVGSGDHSSRIHTLPTRSCTAENTHGNFHIVSTCLLRTE